MRKQNTRHQHQKSETSWAEKLCFGCTCLQLFWGRVVMRKWLNLTTNNSDYSADSDSDSDSASDSVSNSDPEYCNWRGESRFKNDRSDGIRDRSDGIRVDAYETLPRLRRKSETFRAQYINTKEIRICAGTWNVGGRVPPDDLDLDGWLDIDEPADVYVIGLQEIIPLNAGNIFGAEDRRPVSIWENIIRETLNKIPPVTKFKSHSHPPSPSKFKPSEDAPNIDEILQTTDSDTEEEICPLNEESNFFNEIKDGTVTGENVVDLDASVSIDKHKLGISVEKELRHQFSSPITLDRFNCSRTEDSEENVAMPSTQYTNKLARTLSGYRTDWFKLARATSTSFGSACFRETWFLQIYQSFQIFRDI
ncbi:Type I inositol 1 [Forsythia ovata]|uniref:Type I inositol 1 n=1 Tax=Forsythia ovata TaxID=205694 RepID=A0ABD1U4D3_9LAMI